MASMASILAPYPATSAHVDFGSVSPQSTAPTNSPTSAMSLQLQSEYSDRRKQKRNKPTLNCRECVERKTKCDRARPVCLSCLRRQTPCQYSAIADIINATGPSKPRKRKAPEASRRESQASHVSQVSQVSQASQASPISRTSQLSHAPLPSLTPTHERPPSQAQDVMLPPLLGQLTPAPSVTSVPLSRHAAAGKERPALFNLFGMRSQHPFHNYWTSTGGLTEVIDVLPRKEEADILVDKFFETVDPIYPVVQRNAFNQQYERFWSLSQPEKHASDPTFLALQFIMYASATQFVDAISPDERVNTAEFYLSACHQSLCISSYLNQCSPPTIQTMVLICNFLVSNNRISDAWTFSGITQRQAYGLELNRPPEIVRPNDSFAEKQLCCRLWLVTMFQDTSLSLYLELPPATIHHDIQASCLQITDDLARRESLASSVKGEGDIDADLSSPKDVAYSRALWDYTLFAQTHLCVPKCLKRPFSTDAAHKAQLIALFRDMYLAWDDPFNSFDPIRFEGWDSRLVRQTIALSSNYFFALTVLYMDKNERAGVEVDVYGALDAAHEGFSAFFALARLAPGHLNFWGAAQTRAYTQAVMVGTLLAAQRKPADTLPRDARLMLAKSDFDRYLEQLVRARGCAEFEALQRQRIADLQALRNTIRVA